MFQTVLAAALLLATVAHPVVAQAQETLTKPNVRARAARADGVPYAERDEAMAFADDVAQRRNLDPAWVRQAIGEARFLPTVSRLMQPAPTGTAKNWRVYRSRFIEPVRIRAGARFWRANRDVLQRAEREFGVPADIIVGIIGVETIYGQQMGNFRVIDALSTLSFNFPQSHPRMALVLLPNNVWRARRKRCLTWQRDFTHPVLVAQSLLE